MSSSLQSFSQSVSPPDLIHQNLSVVPIEQAETIPSSWYTHHDVLELEKQCLLSQHWQLVGHESQVKNTGDQLVANIAGQPIIVARGNDNTLRGFYNVCRHRGGPIAMENCNSHMLQCKYHGWTYTLDGMLRGVPKFDRAELFDKKDYGLIPIEVDVWDGLVFVRCRSFHNQSLKELVRGISERIAPVQIHSMNFYKRVTYELDCNWKVYVDNFLEGYHIPIVHPELGKLLDCQQYVTETFDYYSLQYSPFTSGDTIYGQGKGEAYYYFIFPNMMLNILPGRLQTNLILPLSHRRTLVVFDYYYDDIASPEALKKIHDDIEYSETIQQEDIEICEHVQRGLESSAYDKGRFSVEMEQGVYHFQNLLKKSFKNFLKL
jgi:choline monooxygenase